MKQGAVLLKFILPLVLAVLISVVGALGVFKPAIENYLMDQKKTELQTLVGSFMSSVEALHQLENSGEITREEAQRRAIHIISSLRYGKTGKDYVWVNDYNAKLILHPYRQDLVGKNLWNLQDPDGVYLFRRFATETMQTGQAFIQYKWQLHDNQRLVLPKLSLVKRYSPWHWIIGTGVYIDDIQKESQKISQLFLFGMWAFLSIILLLFGITSWSAIRDTNRIQREAALVKRVFRQTPQWIALLDKDGRLLRVNRPLLDHEDSDEDDIQGLFLWDVSWWKDDIPDQPKLINAIHDAAQGHTSQFTCTHSAAGIVMCYTVKPIKNTNGHDGDVLVFGDDITELHSQ